jgi:hypothetical protein
MSLVMADFLSEVCRDLLVLQNPTGETGSLFLNFGAPATADGTSLGLAPGERVQFDQHCAIPTDSVHATAANAGHKFVLMVAQRGNVE